MESTRVDGRRNLSGTGPVIAAVDFSAAAMEAAEGRMSTGISPEHDTRNRSHRARGAGALPLAGPTPKRPYVSAWMLRVGRLDAGDRVEIGCGGPRTGPQVEKAGQSPVRVADAAAHLRFASADSRDGSAQRRGRKRGASGGDCLPRPGPGEGSGADVRVWRLEPVWCG